MRRALAVPASMLLAVTFAAACSSARHRTPEATQENFGVTMARQNLWREAMFRFQRAVAINPSDANAHNNLAVAYEANGEFDKAAKEYREAMRLDKSNQYIQKNYSRFVEFTSRNKKRQQKQQQPATKTASTKDTAPATSAPVPPPAAPPPDAAAAPGSAVSPQPAGTAPADVTPPATTPPPPGPPPPKPPGVQP